MLVDTFRNKLPNLFKTHFVDIPLQDIVALFDHLIELLPLELVLQEDVDKVREIEDVELISDILQLRKDTGQDGRGQRVAHVVTSEQCYRLDAVEVVDHLDNRRIDRSSVVCQRVVDRDQLTRIELTSALMVQLLDDVRELRA